MFRTSLVLSLVPALLFLTVQPAMAAEAHNHGFAEVSIAFDATKGKVELKAASDGIVGFEHAAKSAKDKKKEAEQLKKLETQISEMVRFESSLKCKFKKEKLENTLGSEGHSDVSAIFAVECAKSPIGSTLVFSFKKYFPALTDVDVQILTDSLQKSAEVTGNGVQVELKP